MSLSPVRAAFVILLVLGLGGGVSGLTRTWTGGGGADTSWSNAANWDTAPISTDDVRIDGTFTVTMDGPHTVANLYFNYNNANSVTLNLAGQTLTVTNGFNFSQGGRPASNVSIIGNGTINAGFIDANETATNLVSLSNNVSIVASGTLWGNQNPGTSTTFQGDGTCSLTAATLSGAGANIVFNSMTITTGGITYQSPTLSAAPVQSSTVTVTVTGSFAAATQFQFLALYNTAGGAAESYNLRDKLGANPLAVTVNVNTATNLPGTSDAGSFQFQIQYPAMDTQGDELAVTILAPSGFILGTITYVQPSATTYNWTGATSDWSLNTNWSGNTVPNGSAVVTIPSGTPASPVLTVNSQASSVTVASGATLDLAGFNLTGMSSFTNNGTVRLKGTETVAGTKTNGATSTVEYYGPSASPTWGTSYQNLAVTAGTLTLTAATTVVAGSVTNAAAIVAGGHALTFAGYSGVGTVNVSGGTLTNSGAVVTVASLTVGAGGATLAGGAGLIVTGALAGGNLTTSGAVSLSGLVGTLTNSGALTLTGNLTAGGNVTNSGTLNDGGQVVTVSGNVDFTGGTAALTGTLVFNGTSVFTPNGQTAANITLGDALGPTETLTLGGNLTQAGAFATTAGGNRVLNLGGRTWTLSGNLNFANLTTLSAAGSTLTLAGTGSPTVSANGKVFDAVSVTRTAGTASLTSSLGAATFAQSGTGTVTLNAGATLTVTTSTSVTAGTLNLTGTYAGTGATFSINGVATVTVSTNPFGSGALSLTTGTFTQTGDNAANVQQVASLTVNSGTMDWDSGLNGGSVIIVGALTQTAGALNLHQKNIALGTSASGTFTVYDLKIPSGKTLVPSATTAITVNRNLDIQSGGFYTATAGSTLTFGGVGGVAGTLTDSNGTPNDLGVVTVSTATKTMVTPLVMTSLAITSTLVTNDQGLTVSGALTGAGALVATAGGAAEVITVGGNFTVNSFTAANSTVVLNTSTAASFGVAAGYAVNNLTLSKGAAGTLVTPAGDVTVGGTLAWTQGTWSAGATVLTITTGSWNSTAGTFTFTPGSGTVDLGAASPGINTKVADNFNNLTLEQGGSLSSNVTVGGNFLAANGGAGGTLSLNSATLSVAGTVNLKPGATGVTLAAGTSTLTLAGAGGQNVTSNAQTWNTVSIATRGAGTVGFTDALNTATLTVAAGAYSVSLGAWGTTTNAVTFGNSGTLTIVSGYDFAAGAVATAGPKTLAGTISAAGTGVLNFGTTTVTTTADTTLGGASTGTITVGAATLAAATTLTLGSGVNAAVNAGSINGASGTPNLIFNTLGAVTVSGAVGPTLGTVTVTNSGGTTFQSSLAAGTLAVTATTGTVAVQGNLTLTSLTVAAGAYAVSLTGTTNSVTNAVTFNNTGTLTIAGTTTAFSAGVTASAPGSKSLAGTISAAAGVLDFGTTPVTTTANATLGGTSTGTITVGAATVAAASTLTLGAGAATPVSASTINGSAATSNLTINTTGLVTVAGAVGPTLGIITVTNSGGATFQNTVAATTATLTATTGTIDFQGSVMVTNINTTGGGYTVRFQNSGSAAAAVTFSNIGGLTIDNGFTFTGGVVATSGPKTLAGIIDAAGTGLLNFGTTSVTTTADTTLGGTSTGTITVGAATLAAATTLTLGTGVNAAVNAGSINGASGTPNVVFNTLGAVTVSGAVGPTAGTVTVTNSGGMTFQSSLAAGTLAVTATTGTVAAQGNLTLTSLTVAAGAYAVSLTGTTNSVTNAVTFNNTGTVTLGNGGDSLAFPGGVTHTAGATSFNSATDSSPSDQTWAASTLAGNTTLTANKVFFNSTVSGGFTLGITGAAQFSNTVSGLASLTVSGASDVNTTSVTTVGIQTYSGPVTLGSTTTMTTTSVDVTFGSALDGTVPGSQALTIAAGTGNVVFTGVVGGTVRLGALNVTGGTGGNFIKPGANMAANSITFTGPVQLQNTLTMNTTANNGNVVFTSTIDALASGVQALTVTAGSGTVSVAGTTGATPLGALSLTSTNGGAAALSVRAVTTTGTQTYTGLTTLNGTLTTTDANVTFTALATLAGASTITTGLAPSSSTVDLSNGVATGGLTLDVNFNASQTAAGTIKVGTVTGGGTTQLGFNSSTGTVTGQLQLWGNVNVAAFRTGTPVVVESTPLSVTATGTEVRFTNTVNGATAGGQDLTLTANTAVNLGNSAGTTQALHSLTANGTAGINLGNTAPAGPFSVVTTTDQTYTSPGLVLGQSYTLDSSSANGDVLLASPVNATTAGAQALTIQAGTGNVTFTGVVGTTRLGALAVTGGTGGKFIKPTANVAANSIQFTGPIQLQSTLTLDTSASNGALTLTSTVDPAAAQGLTLAAGSGAISVAGPVGGTSRLGALTVSTAANAGFTNAVTAASFTQSAGTGTTTFSAAQDYTGNFAFTGSALTVGGTVNVGGTSTVTNGGLFTLGASAAWTSAAAFNQNGAGANSLGSNITAANAALTLTRAATLTANVQLSTGAVGGTLTLSGAVDADVASNNRTLTLGAGSAGTMVATAAIGGTQSLALLALSSGASASFSQPVTVTAMTTTASVGNVSLASTTNVTSATAFLNTGTLTLGSVGVPVQTFAGGLVTSGSATNPSSTSVGGTVQTNGNLLRLGPTALIATSTLSTTNSAPAGAALTVTGALSGAFNLTTQSGTAGTTTFQSTIGSAGTRLGTGAGTSLTLSTGTLGVFGDDVYLARDLIATIPVSFTKAGTTQIFDTLGAGNFNNVTTLTTAQPVNLTGVNLNFTNALSDLRVGAGGATLAGNADFTGGKLTGYGSGTPTIAFTNTAVSTVIFNTFTANGNPLLFAGSANTAWTTNGQTMAAVTVNKTSGTLSLADQTLTSAAVSLQSAVSATGTTGTHWTIASGGLTVGGSAVVSWTDSLFTVAGGNVTVAGTLNLSTTASASGALTRGLVFTGTGQALSNTGTLGFVSTILAYPIHVLGGTTTTWPTGNPTWTGGDVALGSLVHSGTVTQPSGTTLYLLDSAVTLTNATLAGTLQFDGLASGSSYDLTVAGSLNIAAATIAGHTNGTGSTVTFTNSGAATLTAATPATGKTLHHLALSGVGTLQLATDLGLSGNLTQSAGTFNLATGQRLLVQGNVSFSGTVTATAPAFLVLFPNGPRTLGASGTGNLQDLDVYLAANTSSPTVTQTTNLTVRRLVTFVGGWATNGHNLTTTEDFVAFGRGFATVTDNERTGTRPGNTLFDYPYWSELAPSLAPSAVQTLLSGSAFGSAPGVLPLVSSALASSFTMTGGTITVGRNFYNHGATMTGGAWNLALVPKFSTVKLGDPAKTTTDWFGRPFAVAINSSTSLKATIANSTATQPVAAAWSLVPGAQLNDGGSNNANWDFTAPTIFSAQTLFDNLVEVTFTESILNVSNEARFATATAPGGTSVDRLRFNGGAVDAQETFDFTLGPLGGVTPESVAVPAAAIDKNKLSFQTTGADSWNTDATGTSTVGVPSTSTNRSGTAGNIVPNITIEKGRLFDTSGNPLKNYGANSEPIYNTVKDGARPVLIKVQLGQAAKTFPTPSTEEDGHNYWHLVWSEPVNFYNPAGTLPAVGGINAAGQVGSVPSPTASGNLTSVQTFGDSYTVDPSNIVQLTGLAQYPGNLYRGSRLQNAGNVQAAQTTVTPSNSLARSAAGNDLYVYLTGASSGGLWDGFWWGDTSSPAGQAYTVAAAYVNQVKDVSTAKNPVEDDNVRWAAAGLPFGPSNDPKISSMGLITNDAVNPFFPETDTTAHQGWEMDRPVFAPYTIGGGSSVEIIPLDLASGDDIIDQVQFHILANKARSGQSSWVSTTHPDQTPVHYGIRDSSMNNFYQGLTLELATDLPFGFHNFNQATSTLTSVNNTLFNPLSTLGFSTSDDGYFTLLLNLSVPAGWKPTANYLVNYDGFAGMATNLAGRMLDSALGMQTADRTPPTIALTLTGKDMTTIYVQFSRPVSAVSPGGKASFQDVLSLSGSNSITSMTFLDRSKTATDFQQALLHLASPFNPAEIGTARLNAATAGAIASGPNTMDNLITYPVSFLGLNLVEPVWASDGQGAEANQTGTAHVIHDFAGGEFLAARDIELQVKVWGGSALTGLPLRMFFDLNVPQSRVVNNVWLPSGLPSFLPGIVPTEAQANGQSRYLDPTTSASAGSLKNFLVPGTDQELKSGSDLQFLFRLGSLYVVRGTNPADPTALGIWRVPLKSIRTQKNGVTILHNVIDPTQGQKTQILYTMEKAGVAVAQVFALDGSLVKVLARGRQAPGDYSVFWDGKNEGGSVVARGVYFVRVVAPGIDETRNILVIK